MQKKWLLLLGLSAIVLSLSACDSTMPDMVNLKPVSYQHTPEWLAQLHQQDIQSEFYPDHIELKLPIYPHFIHQTDIPTHLIAVLAPVAQQLKNNHYHVAEVYHYADLVKITKAQSDACALRLRQVMNALTYLNVESKVIVDGQAKLKRMTRSDFKHGKYQPPLDPNEGQYIAINLYQTHQGHGLVY